MTTKIPNFSFRTMITSMLVSSLLAPTAHSQTPSPAASEAPLVRATGISQEQIEAMSEAQSRVLLSDFLDYSRPGTEMEGKLTKLIERAQAAWLSGTTDTARVLFKDIAHLAFEADWREPQREAVFYAHLRLAQSAPTPTERDEWIQKAVTQYPDLQADPDVFPPPILASVRTARARALGMAKLYSPYAHFVDYRYLLINGKRYVITPSLKIRLPVGTHRVTALSDLYPRVSERLTNSQMETFRVSIPPIASGGCTTPVVSTDSRESVSSLAVAYSTDCVRIKGSNGWLPQDVETNAKSAFDMSDWKSTRSSGTDSSFPISGANTASQASMSKRTWLWIGVAALAIGAAAVIRHQMNRPAPEAPAPAPSAPTIRTEPVHHVGF